MVLAQADFELASKIPSFFFFYNVPCTLELSLGLLRENILFMLLRADNLMLLLISTICPGMTKSGIPHMLIAHVLTNRSTI